MKILSVNYHDDNFGDMLIKTCFKQLLNAVFDNYNETNYSITEMNLKEIDAETVCNADVIFFSGGGLFGLSYLKFFDYMKEIVDIAEDNNIPVYFSSIGINNMDVSEDNEDVLFELLSKKCIKAISVREDLDTFEKYGNKLDCRKLQVCDPVVWAKYIFKSNITTEEQKGLVGINVVRKGLFESNNVNWSADNQIEYLRKLHKILDEKRIQHVFFTNGSKADNLTLYKLAKIENLSDDMFVPVHSSLELINTVNKFSAVAAIRMHASIVSYALGKPSINLVWNSKIPFFYSYIKHPERAVNVDDWTAEYVASTIEKLMNTEIIYDVEYAMTLYRYLFDIVGEIIGRDKCKMYSFDEICDYFKENPVEEKEEITDLRLKIKMLEKRYSTINQDKEDLTKELKETKSELKKANNTVERMVNSRSWKYTAWLRKAK